MKKFVLFFSIIFFLVACKKEHNTVYQKDENNSFEIEYIDNKSNLKSFDFKYSVPKNYSHIIIKETIYQYEKEIIEETIIDQSLEKNTGTIQIEQEDNLEDNNLIVFNFKIPLTPSKSIIESNKFSLNSTNLNVFGANTKIGNDPNMILLAYKEKISNESKDSVSLDDSFFQNSTDISKKIQNDEIIIVWSCNFIKNKK